MIQLLIVILNLKLARQKINLLFDKVVKVIQIIVIKVNINVLMSERKTRKFVANQLKVFAVIKNIRNEFYFINFHLN